MRINGLITFRSKVEKVKFCRSCLVQEVVCKPRKSSFDEWTNDYCFDYVLHIWINHAGAPHFSGWRKKCQDLNVCRSKNVSNKIYLVIALILATMNHKCIDYSEDILLLWYHRCSTIFRWEGDWVLLSYLPQWSYPTEAHIRALIVDFCSEMSFFCTCSSTTVLRCSPSRRCLREESTFALPAKSCGVHPKLRGIVTGRFEHPKPSTLPIRVVKLFDDAVGRLVINLRHSASRYWSWSFSTVPVTRWHWSRSSLWDRKRIKVILSKWPHDWSKARNRRFASSGTSGTRSYWIHSQKVLQ